MLRDLRHETALQHAGRERNQVAPEQGRFLAWLLETLGARRIIEVGVFTGYSSIAMALVRHRPESTVNNNPIYTAKSSASLIDCAKLL